MSDTYQANADPIQGARAIRTNPALLAALMSPPTAAPSSDDPNVAALATHNEPGAQGGKTVARSKPSAALASAIASAPVPLPPIRPSDLEAITALASPPGASSPMDPSIAARAAASSSSPSPQPVPIDPSIAARTGAMANPPVSATAPVYAADPGAAQRAALHINLTGTYSWRTEPTDPTSFRPLREESHFLASPHERRVAFESHVHVSFNLAYAVAPILS